MIVQCTWKAADGRQIGDAVTWSDEGESVDVEDEVKAENCLLLEAPDNGSSGYLTAPACQLLLSCQPPHQIQHISVLSEARVMEVYGHHGEYLKTIRNELLEVVEDMAVFRGDIVLERPLIVCSLKFACLRSKNEMWLYGVKVSLIRTDELPSPTKIPLGEVEQRLNEMGLKLSDKAEAFKQLVERCQSSPDFIHQDIGSVIALLQMSNLITEKRATPQPHESDLLSAGSLRSIGDDGSAEAKELNQDSQKELINNYKSSALLSHMPHIARDYLPEFASVSTSPLPVHRNTSVSQTDEAPPGLEERLKAYVDEKLQEFDKQLWEKIQRRFQETEQKILCKLDEIESFVKPQGVGR